jgi:fucose 4-O-acetylase-like acetyltransferase
MSFISNEDSGKNVTKQVVQPRDTYVDFLRALGLLLIFVAHTQAPDILARIRTFDVPLMVFISGLCVNFRGGI